MPTISAILSVAIVPFPSPASPPGLLPAPAAETAWDPMTSASMRADARLADVAFVDPLRGWAVGDRGTIWHTDDGGNNWHLQQSGVACRLESVHFLDENNGWAVGGFSHPYTHTGTAVVLSTRDGGLRWTRNPESILPALKRIRFFNRRRGSAVGYPSAMFPSGVFTTADGGETWQPLPGARTAGWVAADFLSPHLGVLIDAAGAAATIEGGRIETAETARFGLRRVGQVQLASQRGSQAYGWLVGDGGLVMWTDDMGATWQTPRGSPPDGAPRQFDFRALAVRGRNVWIAGSPGTRVLHSPDFGQTWLAFPTSQNLPIRSLAFVDDRHGWAVGELGTILATTDGGRTWKQQRSGGTRAALLGLFGRPEDVPLELFARLSGNDGYLGVVETLGRRDVDAALRTDVPLAERFHEALVGVGGSCGRTAWRFPMRERELKLDARQITRGWDWANDNRGLDALREHVVRQIRLWRPEVIVTHDSGDDPLADLVHQVVLEAARQAAEPTSHIEQITAASLQPWQVKRVYAARASGARAAVRIATTELADRLGRSLADVATVPRGLIGAPFETRGTSFGFRRLADGDQGLPAQKGLFAGIVLPPGGEARRELLKPSTEAAGLIRRIVQKRRNMQAVLQRVEADPTGGAALLAQAGDLTSGLDADASAQIFYHLAESYRRRGNWPTAAEAFTLLADRHPDHPLTRSALVWLVQYHASGEAARRAGPRPQAAVLQTSAPAIDPGGRQDGPERAAELARRIQQTRPDLFAEPGMRFPLSAADRQRGLFESATRFYLGHSRGTSRDAWALCARGERWLVDPKGSPPKPILDCGRVLSKPYLDGRLDDPVWQKAKRAELKSPYGDDADWPAAVMLAYDGEFLYVAVVARKAPRCEYPIGEGPRPRDPDLSARDRVELLVDVDRDYATYYGLSLDHRGWPHEACWGDATWDPTWHVAAEADDAAWAVEAAIPLAELARRPPAARSVWAIGIQRIVPGVGFQSWSRPAAPTVIPEGFGYLAFE
jgi:photosystem II stability/assembly factor-like uncharacterized protein